MLKRYAFPQGDIATAMSEAAEIRGASRGVVGYDSVSLISSMKKQHDEHVEAFEAKLEQIRPCLLYTSENVFNLPDDAIIVEGAKKALVNMGIL